MYNRGGWIGFNVDMKTTGCALEHLADYDDVKLFETCLTGGSRDM